MITRGHACGMSLGMNTAGTVGVLGYLLGLLGCPHGRRRLMPSGRGGLKSLLMQKQGAADIIAMQQTLLR